MFLHRFAILILLFFGASSASAAAAESIRISRDKLMRPAGKYVFIAKAENINAKAIKWTLERTETSPDGAIIVTANAASANGKRAEFELTAKPQVETRYRLRAAAGAAADEISLLIFPAGEMSSFDFESEGNPTVKTYLVAPPRIDRNTRILFVMHGQKRNAVAYLESWREWASRSNFIAVSPHFTDENWDDARSYNLGNLFDSERGLRGEMKPPNRWTFTIVEGIFSCVRDGFGVEKDRFDLWGHSAGAQFVHRFLFFKPNAPVGRAIAANAGWYTLPDLETAFPYGWRHEKFDFSAADVRRYTRFPLVLMRGTLDVVVDENVRTTPEANRQGANRFERARFMLDAARKVNPRSRWRLIDVPDAAHEQQKMAVAAQKILAR